MARMLQKSDPCGVGGRQDRALVVPVLSFQQGLGAHDIPRPDAREQIRQGSRDVLRRRTRRRGSRHALPKPPSYRSHPVVVTFLGMRER